MIKVAIADSNILFRQSLSALLNNADGIQVVLQAENGKELLEHLPKNPADIVLMDIKMPKLCGFETCSILHSKFPRLKILILSELSSKETIQNIMHRGANGFCSKNIHPKELEQAIHNIKDTGFVFEKELSNVLIQTLFSNEKIKTPSIEPAPCISSREIDIIKLVCRGFSSVEIAKQLCIAVSTVNTHRQRIMAKTESRSFIEVIVFMLKHGLLLIEDF